MNKDRFPSTVPGDIALVLSATQFASERHAGQVRRYTGEPYLHHLLAVSRAVATRTMDPNVIAAAVLHDVLEDTPTSPTELMRNFSTTVMSLVIELTDVYTHTEYPKLNRARRKELERLRLAEISADAQLIKAYDLLDNTKSITAHDPGFARVYLDEKRKLVPLLTKLDPHERILLADSLELYPEIA